MTYNSLITKLENGYRDFDSHYHLLRYKGNLENLLNDFIQDLTITHPSRQELRNLVLTPPRIVRAVIDYKIRSFNPARIEELTMDSINLALNAYKEPRSALGLLGPFMKKIEYTGNEALFYLPLTQEPDDITWRATKSEFSQASAEKLHNCYNIDEKGCLFIALSHGGLMPGMDTFLRYQDLTDNASQFYTVRFSRTKIGEEYPSITEKEKQYLIEQGKDRRIVIFDEDTCTGKTIKYATDFFNENFFPLDDIITLINFGKHNN